MKATVDSQWGFTAGADQADDLYSDSTYNVEGISTSGVQLNGMFNSTVLDDGASSGKDNHVFAATIVVAGALGYEGDMHQYELMVPTATQSVDTYYFYMSLNE